MRAEQLLQRRGFAVVQYGCLDRADPMKKKAIIRRKSEAVMFNIIGRMVHGIGRVEFDQYMQIPNLFLCIEEKSSGDVLLRRITDLRPHHIPCRCMFCKRKEYDRCLNQPGGMVYFARDLFEDITDEQHIEPEQMSFI